MQSQSGTVRACPTSAPHTSTSCAEPSSRQAGGHHLTGKTYVDGMEGDEAEVSHATNLHPLSTAQAVSAISDSIIDIFDSVGVWETSTFMIGIHEGYIKIMACCDSAVQGKDVDTLIHYCDARNITMHIYTHCLSLVFGSSGTT